MANPRIAELPLVSGHLALDLVNTVEPRLPAHEREERLVDPDDLLVWSRRAHVLEAQELPAVVDSWQQAPRAAQRALDTVKDIREALSAILTALLDGAQPTSTDLEYVSVTWASAAARSRLVMPANSGVAARWDVGTSPALLIPDRIAYVAVELLCHVDLSRLKACPPQDGGCAWLFLDHTRNGSRRWCSMDDCGTQAKIRRLTERRRAAVAPKDKTTRPAG